MRTAIISDIHGNALALSKVLEHARAGGTNRFVCLGDAIQGGPQPAQVVQLLRELDCPTVMGNADDWLLSGIDSGAESISDARRVQLEEVRSWTLGQLTQSDREFITSFKPTIGVTLGGHRKLVGYHGSPQSYDHMIFPTTPATELQAMLNPSKDTVYAGGHTHVQFMTHLGSTFHLNPGSVGFAYRHGQQPESFRADPWAEYAVVESSGERLSLEFHRVPFDAEELSAIYRRSGRPHSDAAIRQLQPL